METVKIVIFLILTLAVIVKIVLHLKLKLSSIKFSFWSLFIIGLVCQPFVPILSNNQSKEKKIINGCVVLFFASLLSLILLSSF